jgi:hypothetical protein
MKLPEVQIKNPGIDAFMRIGMNGFCGFENHSCNNAHRNQNKIRHS